MRTPAPDPLTRCRHEFEDRHCGHCGAAELRQPLTNNGRIVPEANPLTRRQSRRVYGGLLLAVAVGAAVHFESDGKLWQGGLAAIVAGAMILLGLLRLVADGAGER